jgi:tetratricopeptide (TPR) repeat protein
VGLKTKIKKLVRLSHKAEQSYIDALSEEERAIVGKSDDWAPKDILAHMTAWKEQVIINYQAGKRGEEEPEQSDNEVLSTQFFEKHHPRSWEEILDYREQTQQSLLKELEAMSEADLKRTEGIPMQRGRPFWRVIVGIAYSHPLMHLRDPILSRGDFEQAVEVQEQACRLLSELDDDEAWKGAQQYNLACTYSLVGQKKNAIRILRKALRMTPELMEWSKEDPDFKPIREHPDYKPIYS